MNALMDLSRKHIVGRSEDSLFLSNEVMTAKNLSCHLRQELVGKNVERTKQVSYEHYDVLLWNKFKFPSGALML